MEEDYGYVQDVTADLESGVITSIMVARKRIDIIGLNLRECVVKRTMLQKISKKGQAMLVHFLIPLL